MAGNILLFHPLAVAREEAVAALPILAFDASSKSGIGILKTFLPTLIKTDKWTKYKTISNNNNDAAPLAANVLEIVPLAFPTEAKKNNKNNFPSNSPDGIVVFKFFGKKVASKTVKKVEIGIDGKLESFDR